MVLLEFKLKVIVDLLNLLLCISVYRHTEESGGIIARSFIQWFLYMEFIFAPIHWVSYLYDCFMLYLKGYWW